MSGAPDDRWRGGRAYDQNRQSGQRHSNPRAMSAHAGPREGQQNTNQSNTTSWADTMNQEQHIPVGGFNAAEAKTALRRGPGGPKPFYYKPPGKDANNRGGSPWASKPNTMANGKDFFIELRKQVTALRQGETIPGG
ncbi:hypothetical protein BJY04DRAFT_199648 [Aspergillus karnatakaensis]|uniref:uncharacterized protein n=1 Tax=Aspergillus karnatakaensis TaxID=1810916 RepID=UPI003CCDE578